MKAKQLESEVAEKEQFDGKKKIRKKIIPWGRGLTKLPPCGGS